MATTLVSTTEIETGIMSGSNMQEPRKGSHTTRSSVCQIVPALSEPCAARWARPRSLRCMQKALRGFLSLSSSVSARSEVVTRSPRAAIETSSQLERYAQPHLRTREFEKACTKAAYSRFYITIPRVTCSTRVRKSSQLVGLTYIYTGIVPCSLKSLLLAPIEKVILPEGFLQPCATTSQMERS